MVSRKDSGYLEKSKQYKGFHYSVIEQSKLEYIHQRTLEIFLQIKEILDANEIRYMICGGTLLGAATTGKFIPWDDDFDMCVFEDDYDRAKQLLIQQMAEDVIVQCPETEQHYFHGWVKVRDKKTCVYPKTDSYENNGVWVDMYKLTKAKRKDIDKLIAEEHLAYLERRCNVGDITPDEKERRIVANNVRERIESARKASISSSDNSNVYIIWSASKIVLDENWVTPLCSLCLENHDMTTFGGYQEYLTAHYGIGYDQLPPYEKRRIGINNIDIF